MTPSRFRALACSLPDVVEGSHHDHPDFRAGGRVFASLHPDGQRAMVKLPLDEQRRLVGEHGAVFVPANGAWGRAGCTMVTLAAAPVDVVRDALASAWQAATVRPGAKRSGAAKRSRR